MARIVPFLFVIFGLLNTAISAPRETILTISKDGNLNVNQIKYLDHTLDFMKKLNGGVPKDYFVDTNFDYDEMFEVNIENDLANLDEDISIFQTLEIENGLDDTIHHAIILLKKMVKNYNKQFKIFDDAMTKEIRGIKKVDQKTLKPVFDKMSPSAKKIAETVFTLASYGYKHFSKDTEYKQQLVTIVDGLLLQPSSSNTGKNVVLTYLLDNPESISGDHNKKRSSTSSSTQVDSGTQSFQKQPIGSLGILKMTNHLNIPADGTLTDLHDYFLKSCINFLKMFADMEYLPANFFVFEKKLDHYVVLNDNDTETFRAYIEYELQSKKVALEKNQKPEFITFQLFTMTRGIDKTIQCILNLVKDFTVKYRNIRKDKQLFASQEIRDYVRSSRPFFKENKKLDDDGKQETLMKKLMYQSVLDIAYLGYKQFDSSSFKKEGFVKEYLQTDLPTSVNNLFFGTDQGTSPKLEGLTYLIGHWAKIKAELLLDETNKKK